MLDDMTISVDAAVLAITTARAARSTTAAVNTRLRRAGAGGVLGLTAAALLLVAVKGLLETPACSGTSEEPCQPGTLLYVAGMVAGIGLSVAATFLRAGMFSFAATCLAVGSGSLLSSPLAEMGSFPTVFGVGWIGLGLLPIGLWCWLRQGVRANRLLLERVRSAGEPGTATVTSVAGTGIDKELADDCEAKTPWGRYRARAPLDGPALAVVEPARMRFMDIFEMMAVAQVHGGRRTLDDDDWGDVEATLTFDPRRFGPEVLAGLAEFSHVDVVYVFDQVDEDSINLGARHPRGRIDWPRVGIFAQRAKARPNRIGVTTCELRFIDGLTAGVRGLDAIDGTPVLDVKPYMAEFAPRSATYQPEWANELMAEYWQR